MKIHNERGSAILTAIIFIAVLGTMVSAFLSNILAAHSSAKRSYQCQIAFNLAEAGIDKALTELSQSRSTYNGEKDTCLGQGAFSVSVSTSNESPKEKIITSTGYLPDSIKPKVKKTIEVTVQRRGKSLLITSWREISY